MTTSDAELLEQFAHKRSEEAFAVLVKRHVDLVYSAALRQVRSPQLAEEVAQSVFVDLSRNAIKLKTDTVLTAWLYRVTRRTAIDVVRSESRRQLREQIAVELADMKSPDASWNAIEPLLDEAMETLDEADRSSILLRYFDNKSLREVGQALGTSDDAAQKRVSRAVERLREFFSKRGVTVGASAFVAAISANAVQAAPLGLAAVISTSAAFSGTTIAATTATKTIIMTTLQKTLITITLGAAVGTGIYETRRASRLQAEIQTLQKQQVPLARQLVELKTENERLSHLVAQTRDAQVLSQAQLSELVKLRGKSGQAQARADELAQLKAALAQQKGTIPDYFTNAMAQGLSTAGKWKKKDAEARLARMKKMLNLTEAQEQAISDIMLRHIQQESQMVMDAITGKLTPEQRKAQAMESYNQENEIKALFTAGQMAAYPEYKQAEKIIAAESSAKSDASRIADDFNLSEKQQEQLRASFYEMNLKEPAQGSNQDAILEAKKNGDFLESANLGVALQKAKLEEKLKIMESFLSPEQIIKYRQEQMDQIDQQAEGMKAFFPQKTAASKN